MQTQPIGWPSAVEALAVCFVRGGNQVALKFGLTAFTPLWTAYWRMQIGVLAIGAWGLLRGLSLTPARQEWRPLLQLSLLFFVQIASVHVGADFTSPAYAVVLINSNPIFANLIAHFIVPADRLSGTRVLGLIMAFAGVCVVLLGKPQGPLAPSPTLGNSLVVVAALLVGARTVYTQRIVQRIEPTKTVFWQMLLSLPMFLGATLFGDIRARQPVEAAAVLGVLYQGVVISGLSTIGWVTLLRKHSPGALSVFSFTVPIFGVILSAWLFSEAVTTRLIVGVAAVTSGIALATHAGRKAALLEGAAASERARAEREAEAVLRD